MLNDETGENSGFIFIKNNNGLLQKSEKRKFRWYKLQY